MEGIKKTLIRANSLYMKTGTSGINMRGQKMISKKPRRWKTVRTVFVRVIVPFLQTGLYMLLPLLRVLRAQLPLPHQLHGP